MTLILRPIEDSETVTELIGTGADLNIVPKLIWGNEKGMQDFQTKQIQHYRSRAAGEYGAVVDNIKWPISYSATDTSSIFYALSFLFFLDLLLHNR